MSWLFYAALVMALTLACVAGVEYFYLMFLEARSRQQVRRVAELERQNAALADELRETQARLARSATQRTEEWPETLGGRDDYTLS